MGLNYGTGSSRGKESALGAPGWFLAIVTGFRDGTGNSSCMSNITLETEFSTNYGQVAPGATALFKVYVVMTTANEKGSNTVSVTRLG